jgi:two-component system, chemotaxis family, CheB/CheR fusion protein
MDDLLENVTYPVDEKILVLDNDLRVVDASPAFYKTFRLSPAQTVHQHLSELGNGQWNVPELLALLNELPPTDGQFDAFKLQSDFPVLGPRRFLLNARRSSNKGDGTGTILLAIDDVTSQPAAEAELLQPPAGFISQMEAPIT